MPPKKELTRSAEAATTGGTADEGFESAPEAPVPETNISAGPDRQLAGIPETSTVASIPTVVGLDPETIAQSQSYFLSGLNAAIERFQQQQQQQRQQSPPEPGQCGRAAPEFSNNLAQTMFGLTTTAKAATGFPFTSLFFNHEAGPAALSAVPVAGPSAVAGGGPAAFATEPGSSSQMSNSHNLSSSSSSSSFVAPVNSMFAPAVMEQFRSIPLHFCDQQDYQQQQQQHRQRKQRNSLRHLQVQLLDDMRQRQRQQEQEQQQQQQQGEDKDGQQQQQVLLQRQRKFEGRKGRITKPASRSYPGGFKTCMLCGLQIHSSKLPCHIRQIHIREPMFLCRASGCKFYSTYSKNNVKSHMHAVHGMAEHIEPINYMNTYADLVYEFMGRCFPGVRRRRGRPNGNRTPRTARSLSPASVSDDSVNINNNDNNNSNSVSDNSSRRASISSSASADSGRRAVDNFRGSDRRRSAPEPIPELPEEDSNSNSKQIKMELINSSAVIADSDPGPSHCGIINLESSRSNGVNGPSRNEQFNGDLMAVLGGINGSGMLMDMDVENSSTSSSSPPVGHDADLDRASIDDADQRLRYENIQPRYLPEHAIAAEWPILDENQIRGTVFEEFPPIFQESGILQNVPRYPFDVIPSNAAFATEEQLKRVQEVRERIPLTTVQLCDALNRFDSIQLSVEYVDLIASIAPSAMDITRLLNYENANPGSITGVNEHFLLMLAKIKRLEEKLHAMSFLGHFRPRANDILRRLEELTNAANTLHGNDGFRKLLQVIVVCCNFTVGDFRAEALRGFRTSALMEVCSVEVGNGESKTTLLQRVAATISEKFPDVRSIGDILPALERAARANFQELSTAIRRFETDYLRFAQEANRLDDRERMSGYIEVIQKTLRDLHRACVVCKAAVAETMRYFGEPVNDEDGPAFSPEKFFASIVAFYRKLKNAWLELKLKNIEMKMRSRKPAED